MVRRCLSFPFLVTLLALPLMSYASHVRSKPQSLSALYKMLQSPDAHKRKVACIALKKHKQLPSHMLEALIKALGDRYLYVRYQAKLTLQVYAKQHPKKLLPLLFGKLKDKTTQNKDRLIYFLGSLGKQADAAIPILLNLTRRGRSYRIRKRACITIRDIAGKSSKRLKRWHQLLQKGDESKRSRAALAIWCLGRSVNKAMPVLLPTLIKGLKDKNPSVRGYCALVLGLTGKAKQHWKSILPILSSILVQKRFDNHMYAMYFLKRAGKASLPAWDAVVQSATSADPRARRMARELLEKFGPTVTPKLRKLLKHPVHPIQTQSALVLLKSKKVTLSPVLLKVIKRGLQDQRNGHRRLFINALQNISFKKIPKSLQLPLKKGLTHIAAEEARRELKHLATSAVRWYKQIRNGSDGNALPHSFPHQSPVKPLKGTFRICTPSQSPCDKKGRNWGQRPWRSLFFYRTGKTPLQYCYETSGVNQKARLILKAHADVDCDGKMSTYQVTVSIDKKGSPKISKCKKTLSQD